jgi:hypothetical protein
MSFFLALALAQATSLTAQAATPAQRPPEDMRIVCRTLQGTGSRLNTERVCLPKREWQRMWDNGREEAGSLQDHASKQDPSGH